MLISMYVEVVPNRKSPPAVLLRESFRQDGKVKKRTLANLSKWAPEKVEALRLLLRDEPMVSANDAYRLVRSLPHGAAMAVLGTLRRSGLERVLGRSRSRERDLVVALIALRILEPDSKLAAARALQQDTATSTLPDTLELEDVSDDELYRAMDWLVGRQDAIERQLARKHLSDGSLVLYDLTSTWLEGRTCPLGRRGYSRDGKKGTLQIVFGLLCDRDGCPVAVEVFSGNTSDSTTVAAQIERLRERFGLQRVVLVGDRGMITQARIDEELRDVPGLDWITALRAPQISKLVEGGAIQLDLFDERDLLEIEHPEYPGERLVVCRNPRLAQERVRKREDLTVALEEQLAKVRTAVQRERNPLRGQDAIGVRVGKVLGKSKVAKYITVAIKDDAFEFERDLERMRKDAVLDGLYVVRTSLEQEELDADEVVGTYKRLAVVERAFRRMKSVDLHVRPIRHRLERRVRAHVLLCMLAYYVEWHMRRALAPLLFQDADPEAAAAKRTSPVAKAERSDSAEAKASKLVNDEGFPVHSFKGLLRHLATQARAEVRNDALGLTLWKTVEPTTLQERAFELLGVAVPV
jgi:transposase